MENYNSKKKNSNKKIKYKARIKPYYDKIKVNPEFYKPILPINESDLINGGLFPNKNDSIKIKINQSTTLNHFTNKKDLDAKIKHKKQRIGD